jgi:hypothetical protein
MKKVRISSWEMDGALFLAVDAAREKRRATWNWRRMQSEGLRLLLASWDEPDSLGAAVSAEKVEVLPVDSIVSSSVAPLPAVSAEKVEVLPAVLMSPAEKELKRSRDRVEMHKARIVEANEKLTRNPENVQALKQLSTSQHSLPGAEIDLVEAEKAVAAEKALSSNPVDNETNGGDV